MVVDCSVLTLTESKHGHDTFTDIRYFNFYSQLCQVLLSTEFLVYKQKYKYDSVIREPDILFYYHPASLSTVFLSCHYVLFFKDKLPVATLNCSFLSQAFRFLKHLKAPCPINIYYQRHNLAIKAIRPKKYKQW